MKSVCGELKKAVRRLEPEAYCVRSQDGNLKGYFVWPGRCQPRGFERCAIGYGTTVAKAWAEALITIHATEKNL